MVLHDLRHWAASTALRDDPVTVAARLGPLPDTLLRIYAEGIEEAGPASPPPWPPASTGRSVKMRRSRR